MHTVFADFQELLRRIAARCEVATRDFIARYEPHLLQVIHRSLRKELRPLFDPEDFRQEVWVAFFSRWLPRCRFERPEQVRAYLTRMARSRVIEANRQYLRSHKYDRSREVSLDNPAVSEDKGLHTGKSDTYENIDCEDKWKWLVRKQSRRDRRILALMQEGHSRGRVARKLAIHEKTVRRVSQRVLSQFLTENCDRLVAEN